MKYIYCPNKNCKCYGIINGENLHLKQVQGVAQPIKLMICKECGEVFSERHGTVYSGLKYPDYVFDKVMLLLVCRLSIKDIARITNVSEDTIQRWIKKAEPFLKSFHDTVIKDLELNECQIDELWSFVFMKKKTAKQKGKSDDTEIGDQWIFIAFDPVNKLVIHWKVAKRTLNNAKDFIKEVKERISSSPLFTTDEWCGYEEAFLSNFSEEIPIAKTGKRGRPQKKSRRLINKDLKLAQVHKHRVKGKVVDITKKIVFGDENEINDILSKSPVSNEINTSFIERHNGTIRSKLSRFVRNTYSFSKKLDFHKAHLTIFFAIIILFGSIAG